MGRHACSFFTFTRSFTSGFHLYTCSFIPRHAQSARCLLPQNVQRPHTVIARHHKRQAAPILDTEWSLFVTNCRLRQTGKEPKLPAALPNKDAYPEQGRRPLALQVVRCERQDLDPVFPGEGGVPTEEEARPHLKNIPDYLPFSNIATDVTNRRLSSNITYLFGESWQRLLRNADDAFAYCAHTRFPRPFLRYLSRLAFDSHALPDTHLATLAASSYSAPNALARRQFLRLRQSDKTCATAGQPERHLLADHRHVHVPPAISSSSTYQSALELCQRIQQEGVPAFFTGGAVRDMFLGVLPKDFDIAAGLGSAGVLALFAGSARQMRNSVGTVAVSIRGETHEVTPLRNFHAAHKDNFWSVAAARDATGRDFSLNSLLFDPVAGILYDHNNGLHHLHHNRLAAASMPITSLSEDPIRCLRMLRLAAKYGFDIDRTLGLTAARLSAGRLLSPPCNLSPAARVSATAAEVALDPTREPAASDPRRIVMHDCSHLEHAVLSSNAKELQARREILLDATPSVISTWSAQMMSHEMNKLVAQDRHQPGSLADAISLGLAIGAIEPGSRYALCSSTVLNEGQTMDPSFGMPNTAVASATLPMGWHFAVERLQRMPATMTSDLKLMTLLLGRTRAGVASVQPFVWSLFSPQGGPRRFQMFRMSLLWHHVLHCEEFRAHHPLPCSTVDKDLPAIDALASSIEELFRETGGDHTVLLSLAAAAHELPPRAPCRRSVHHQLRAMLEGGGKSTWNLAYSSHLHASIQAPPFTASDPASTSTAQRVWGDEWPLRVPPEGRDAPWTHCTRSTPFPLHEEVSLVDVCQPCLPPLLAEIGTSFFHHLLLREHARACAASTARRKRKRRATGATLWKPVEAPAARRTGARGALPAGAAAVPLLGAQEEASLTETLESTAGELARPQEGTNVANPWQWEERRKVAPIAGRQKGPKELDWLGLREWTGWDRLRRAPEARSPSADPLVWGLPTSVIKALLVQGRQNLLDAVGNLLETPAARAAFKGAIEDVKREHGDEVHSRRLVTSYLLLHAPLLFSLPSPILEWPLQENVPSEINMAQLPPTPRTFAVDLMLALLAARLWDEPNLMRGSVHLRSLAREMKVLHCAVMDALLRCHSFDQDGNLTPFTFESELRITRALHAEYKGPLRRTKASVVQHDLMWPQPRIGDSGGRDAGSADGRIPDAVVRAAWERAAPWMHTPVPDWWAFKVWDADLMQTTTYDGDAFLSRTSERLYATRAPSSTDHYPRARASSESSAAHARPPPWAPDSL